MTPAAHNRLGGAPAPVYTGGDDRAADDMTEDQQLLRRYVEAGAEDAFAALVHRHLDLVYSAALRQLNGDAHLARDAAQQVFVDLARKAHSLVDRPVLAGWLFTGTRFAAAKLVRREQRRRAREQEAHDMNELTREDAQPVDWARVRPVLDDALGELSDPERDAILLRFFESRAFADIGARLGVAENAARMRVERALDKLHALLRRKGVTSSAAALAAALGSQGVVAAPAGLAAVITTAAVGAGSAVATWFGLTKLQVAASLAVAAAGLGGVAVQEHARRALDRELAGLRAETAGIADLRELTHVLARELDEVRQLRTDDAALGQLRDEALELRRRLAASAPRPDAATNRRPAAGGTRETLDLSKLDRLPAVVHREPPKYPADMLAAGIAGEVLVRLVVDANGQVRDAFPAKSTRPEFELAAIEGVKQWTFDPGLKTGRTVSTRMEVPISFVPGTDAPGGRGIAVGELKAVDNADWF